MTSLRKFIGLLIFCSFLSASLSPAEAGEEDIHKTPERAQFSNLLAALLSAPAKIWRERSRAIELAETLPQPNVQIETPDSETIYSWIQQVCSTPHRRPGTPENRRAEEWVAGKFREFGLENVSMEPIDITLWSATNWSLKVNNKPMPAFYVLNTAFTEPGGLDAPLVYVGQGKRKDFKNVDVRGKIVVADVPILELPTGAMLKLTRSYYAISDPERQVTLGYKQSLTFLHPNFMGYKTEDKAPPEDVYWQAYKGGAKAILLILKGQPSNSNSYYGPYDGIMKPMPAMWIGKYDGEKLRQEAIRGATASMVLEGAIEQGVTHNVWGTLPGVSDEVIMVTSHHDSPFLGAVEDGAGVAQVLAQVKAWSAIPKEKRAKTLVFVIDAGHFYGSIGSYTFAKQHPELMKRTKVVFTLEHLGAKDVEERDGEYSETGHPALTILFTSRNSEVIAAVIKGLEKKPLKATVSLPADIFGPTPPSDAAGYMEAGKVPIISWITGPAYLLDEHDTMDKVIKENLGPIAETVAYMISLFMAI